MNLQVSLCIPSVTRTAAVSEGADLPWGRKDMERPPRRSLLVNKEDRARSREERRRTRRATAKYRSAHASRERVRVVAFNVAFTKLRKLLPTLPPDKRLSKFEILQLAVCYISFLNYVLDV
ncbi:Helix-loop-helix protein 1 [Characodon lateralis]|uniref:Helix-loop-helix protein 1 n=1 Tax=Characodon lateralis TaxID=208331 RepID=A0ABU7DX21_9TELE|nr:Helix-loop-helix protein 1 [Characodon lateralis]